MDIEEIKQFKTNDGSIFNFLDDAQKYNGLLGRCDDIENSLISRPDDTDFNNGIGWIQHPKSTRFNFEKSILKLYNDWFDDSSQAIGHAVSRSIDDDNISCLNHLVYRWECMSLNDIEYGQPYYANNPSTVVGGPINK